MFDTWTVVKAFRADMVEALKSEVVQVLVGFWQWKGAKLNRWVSGNAGGGWLPAQESHSFLRAAACVGDGKTMTDVVGGPWGGGGRCGAHAGTFINSHPWMMPLGQGSSKGSMLLAPPLPGKVPLALLESRCFWLWRHAGRKGLWISSVPTRDCSAAFLLYFPLQTGLSVCIC